MSIADVRDPAPIPPLQPNIRICISKLPVKELARPLSGRLLMRRLAADVSLQVAGF
jgi:hypothetical protein